MYRVVKEDGTELGLTDSVTYIKIADNGCFVPCRMGDAIGVAYDSTPYNLFGHSDIEGADTVIVSVVDGGVQVGSVMSALNILLGVNE